MAGKFFSVEELEKNYPDEWVAAEVVERDEEGLPLLVKLVEHDRDEKKVFDAARAYNSIMIIYTGDLIPKGYGYVLTPFPVE